MTLEFRERDSWFGRIRNRYSTDPDFLPLQPSRKVRGRRGYYRMLRRDAQRFSIQLAGWYDYMHWHVDWKGIGNLRWRERREHVRALFTMFSRLLEQTADWATPHQVWLQIDALDGSQDAVYLHTPNPNRENFPASFDGVEWDVDVPARLQEFITDPSWQFGRLDTHWTHFIVRPRPAA